MATRRSSVLPWVTCLWPGLPQLWLRGDSLGLVAAVMLAAHVNLCIAASWVWPELLTPSHRWACWLAAGAVWLACLPWSYWAMRGIVSGRKGGETLLIAAQTEYLRGNWVETESLVKRQLRRDARDVEARLLLAAVCRRTGRFDEASRQLRRLARLDEAEHWRREIVEEQERITELLSPPEMAETTKNEGPQPPMAARAA